jgi:hypothetical protein
VFFEFESCFSLGLNETLNPEKSPARRKRQDSCQYEQEIRNKLNGLSPIRCTSMTSSSPVSPRVVSSPSDSFLPDELSSSLRPPLSTITPTKNSLLGTYSEKTKPRPLTKRMGFKRAVLQKFKITKHNR